MAQRYEIQTDPDGLWMVVDRFTGLPAKRRGFPLTALPLKEADDLVELLNARDDMKVRPRGLNNSPLVPPSGHYYGARSLMALVFGLVAFGVTELLVRALPFTDDPVTVTTSAFILGAGVAIMILVGAWDG